VAAAAWTCAWTARRTALGLRGEWDGHSAEIDPEKKTIRRLLGLTSLLSASYRRQQVERIRGMGKFVHANGAPEVTTLQTACNSRMVETKFVPIRVTELHLTTPLAYAYGIPDMRAIRERLERGTLCFRARIEGENPVMRRLFPFTPQELHAGWIKARERIVSCRSGQFGWDGAYNARIWRFDAAGALLGADPPVTAHSGPTIPVEVPAAGLVIIERTP